MYVWDHEAYQEWYKCIGDDLSDKAVGIEAEVEVDVKVDVKYWDT